jgi:hypothetical protein
MACARNEVDGYQETMKEQENFINLRLFHLGEFTAGGLNDFLFSPVF